MSNGTNPQLFQALDNFLIALRSSEPEFRMIASGLILGFGSPQGYVVQVGTVDAVRRDVEYARMGRRLEEGAHACEESKDAEGILRAMAESEPTVITIAEFCDPGEEPTRPPEMDEN